MGYTRQTIKGISWAGSFRIVTRAVSFLRTAVLARLLVPADFGFFSVASLVLALSELLTETGINIILIQKKEEIDKYIDTAWVISILRGLVIGIVIFVSAPFISSFFSMPQAYALLLWIAAVPVVRGFINPSVVKFLKDLRFQQEFYYKTSIFIVESVVSIILAFVLRSPISLVYGLLAGAIFEVIISYIFVNPRPRFGINKKYVYEIFSHGKWLTANGVINYLYQNLDNIVIGKMLGAVSLGIYDVAYKISLLPLTEVADVVGRTSFPVMVKINDDIKRLRRAYYKSLLLIATFSVIITIIILLFPSQIIYILLGNQWMSAVSILQLLAVFGLLRAILLSLTHPFYARQKQMHITIIGGVGLVGLGVTVIPFVLMWGVNGAAYSAIFGTILSYPVAIYFLRKVLYE